MSTVYFLMGALLLALLFVEISFSISDQRKEHVKKLLKLDDAHLLQELGRATLLLKLCLISGLLLSGLYAVSAFAGSELQHISEWGLAHWVGAFIGLVVVITITLSQSFAHSSQMHNAGRFVVVLLLIAFAIFSEISNPSEREEMKMAQKSQDSAVFKAVLGEIQGGGTKADYSQKMADARANLATHQFELGRCDRHADKGEKRVKRCEDHENRAIAQAHAQIASYQQADVNAANQSSADKQALILQAKGLEKNTDNHSTVIKFLKEALNTDYQHAMILAALILVVAFEAGFGFAGYNVALYREALVQKGNKDILYAIEAKRIKAAHAFREKTSRYKRDMLTTQDKGSPVAEIAGGAIDRDKDTLDSSSRNIDVRAYEAVEANRIKAAKNEDDPKKAGLSVGVDIVKKYAADYQKKKEQPTTAFTRNDQTGTRENNYDLFGTGRNKTSEQLQAEMQGKGAEKLTVKTDCSDRTPTVKKKGEGSEDLSLKINRSDRRATVKKGKSERSEGQADRDLINAESFDKIYVLIRRDVVNKIVSPSARSLVDAVFELVRKDDAIDLALMTMPVCKKLANTVRSRLLKEAVIEESPNYKNGLAKYRLV